LRLVTKNHDVVISIPTRVVLMEEVRRRFRSKAGFQLATVNLDHLVKIDVNAGFARAYDQHDLIVADGNPIVWVSRMVGKPVELMPGSELVVPLCQLAAEEKTTVALVGSTQATLDAAANHLMEKASGLNVVFTSAPAMGFDPESEAASEILKDIAASGAGLCFLALGAPKQEIFSARGREFAPNVGFASIGAGLDFFSGQQVRAPKWARKLALEWLWRALSSPRRMVPRYAKCFAILPGLVFRSIRER